MQLNSGFSISGGLVVWPAPTYDVAPSTTLMYEGDTVTFNVSTRGLVDGTILYWTNSGTSTAADFTDGVNQGSFSVTSSKGSVAKTLLIDLVTDTTTVVFEIRTDSVTGPIVATASTVTVLNTSIAIGQAPFTTPGIQSWTAPAGVTRISVVCIGGGGGGGSNWGSGGGGGALAYTNNYTVVPGNTYNLYVGNGGAGDSNGEASYFINSSTLQAGYGYAGVPGGANTGGGGGGAAGYAGAGGYGGGTAVTTYLGANGGTSSGSAMTAGYAGGHGGNGSDGNVGTQAGTSGTGGASGGGSGGYDNPYGGGGTGILGQGTNGTGAAAVAASGSGLPVANGGSGGSNGTLTTGGNYGGGGANGGIGGNGAVRIIWPGDLRYFPSANTGDL